MFRHPTIIFQIFPSDVFVVFQRKIILRIVLTGNKNIHLTPLYVFLHHRADGGLKEIKFLRHFNVYIEVAVIHRFDLHCKLPVALNVLTTSKAGHAFDHRYRSLCFRLFG